MKKGTHKDSIERIKKNGFVRLRIDGEIVRIEEISELDKK